MKLDKASDTILALLTWDEYIEWVGTPSTLLRFTKDPGQPWWDNKIIIYKVSSIIFAYVFTCILIYSRFRLRYLLLSAQIYRVIIPLEDSLLLNFYSAFVLGGKILSFLKIVTGQIIESQWMAYSSVFQLLGWCTNGFFITIYWSVTSICLLIGWNGVD